MNDAVFLLKGKDAHLHIVFPGQNCGSHIDCLKILFHDLFIGEPVISLCRRIFGGIRIVNTVDIFGHEDHIRIDLHSAQDDSCVRGKIGMTGPACKKDDSALFKTADSAVSGKLFREGAAHKRSHDLGAEPCSPEDLRDIKAVHDSCQHSDLIRFDSVDLISRAAAPYIAPACHDTDLVSGIMKLFYLGGNSCDHRFIIQLDSTPGIAHRAVVFARQRFPGGCGTCLRHLIEDAGKIYFKDKEARIAAANDKRAVELTKEAQGEGPKEKVAVRTTAPKKPANAKKTTKNAKK